MKVKARRALAILIGAGVTLIGVTAYAVVINFLQAGTISHSNLYDSSATVTVRQLTLNPMDVLPWHYHPGYVFNVIKSGTLTVEDGCGGEHTLTAGQAFEELDGRVHRGKNLSTTDDVVVYNTFIMPDGKPTTRNIPNNERRCGPPTDVNECKDNGWMNFDHPHSFANQGECVEFVRTRPRIVIPLPEDPLGQN
jgi:quercetin dioxygenase-like cupin family protein